MSEQSKGHIRYWFTHSPSSVGRYESDVPHSVQEQVVGIPLPVRHERPIESPMPMGGFGRTRDIDSPEHQTLIPDGVRVEIEDVIKALRMYRRHGAADWYEENVAPESHRLNIICDVTTEGRVMIPNLPERLHPEIVGFEEYQVED